MREEAARIAEAYLQAWQRKDEAGIATFVHPQVEFVGPIAQTKGRDAFLAGAQRMFPLLKEIKIHTMFFSGDQVLFTYDFICVEPVGICRTAELITIKDGQIGRVELFFDPRPFEKLMQQRQAKAS